MIDDLVTFTISFILKVAILDCVLGRVLQTDFVSDQTKSHDPECTNNGYCGEVDF